MKHSSSRDAGGMALPTQRLVPSGNHGYIRNLRRSPSGTSSLHRDAFGGTRYLRRQTCKSLLSVEEHSYGKRKKSQEWLANLCQEPDECEGRIDHPAAFAVPERPWRPPYLEMSKP